MESFYVFLIAFSFAELLLHMSADFFFFFKLFFVIDLCSGVFGCQMHMLFKVLGVFKE